MREILFAGFGGQGILASGIILANAAMKDEKHVTWIPEYGDAQRGGTANCTVIISDQEVPTPFFDELDILIAMNSLSLKTFKNEVKKDGLIIANSSIVTKEDIGLDKRIITVPATEIARNLGNAKVANVVILGSLIRATSLVTESALLVAIRDFFCAKDPQVIRLNEEALKKGMIAI